MALLLAWVSPALATFTLIPNKDARFLLPILPAVALLTAAGLQSIRWHRLRVAAWVAIVATGAFQYAGISFGWPVRIAHGYTAPPRSEDWKIRDILDAVAAQPLDVPIWIGVLPDEPDFEPNLFILAASVGRLPVRIDGLGHERESIAAWRRYRFIVTKSGAIAPERRSSDRSSTRPCSPACVEARPTRRCASGVPGLCRMDRAPRSTGSTTEDEGVVKSREPVRSARA